MFKNILTIFISIIIALGFFEVGLRVTGFSSPIFDDYDPVRGVRLRPGKEGWYRKEGLAYLQINSMGYRDVEHSQKKLPGVLRIAVLGDSFTEARQIPRNKTFWNHLEKQLAECALIGKRRVEVMNFGIGGYNTTQELLTLERDALNFSPDLVLVAFFAGNDISGNSKALNKQSSWRVQGPYHVYENGVLVLDPKFDVPLWRRAIYEATHHFRLLEIVNEARRAWAVRRTQRTAARSAKDIELGTSDSVYAPPSEELWIEAWSITEELLKQMNDMSVAAGSKFAVLMIPTSIQLHPDNDRREAMERRMQVADLFYPERRIASLGEKNGFAVITMGEKMQNIAVKQDTYFNGFENTTWGKGHLNSEGHRVVSKFLSEGLCRKDILNSSIAIR